MTRKPFPKCRYGNLHWKNWYKNVTRHSKLREARTPSMGRKTVKFPIQDPTSVLGKWGDKRYLRLIDSPYNSEVCNTLCQAIRWYLSLDQYKSGMGKNSDIRLSVGSHANVWESAIGRQMVGGVGRVYQTVAEWIIPQNVESYRD